MGMHTATCLKGPITRERAWWRESEEFEALCGENDCSEQQETEHPEMRHDLIARIQREIAAGTYDTEARFEAAMDRLLERLDLD